MPRNRSGTRRRRRPGSSSQPGDRTRPTSSSSSRPGAGAAGSRKSSHFPASPEPSSGRGSPTCAAPSAKPLARADRRPSPSDSGARMFTPVSAFPEAGFASPDPVARRRTRGVPVVFDPDSADRDGLSSGTDGPATRADFPSRDMRARPGSPSRGLSGCPACRPNSLLGERAASRSDGPRSAAPAPTPAVLLAPTRAVSSPNRRRTRSRSSCPDMAATVVPPHGEECGPTSRFDEPVDNRGAVHNSYSTGRRLGRTHRGLRIRTSRTRRAEASSERPDLPRKTSTSPGRLQIGHDASRPAGWWIRHAQPRAARPACTTASSR